MGYEHTQDANGEEGLLWVEVLRPDNTPVSGALVRSFGRLCSEVTTDENGHCRLQVAKRCRRDVHVEAAEELVHTAPRQWPRGTCTVTLYDSTRVTGRLLDEARTPISGAVVGYDDHCPGCRPSSAITDGDGAFELGGVPLGVTISLSVGCAGFARRDFEFTFQDLDDEAADVTLVLERGDLLRGQVRDLVDDAPLQGVTLQRTRIPGMDTVATDENGEFETRLWLGATDRTTLSFEKDGYCTMSASLGVEDVHDLPFCVRLPRWCAVEGTVHDARGGALSGAVVTLGQVARDVVEFISGSGSRPPGSPLSETPETWHFGDEGPLLARTDENGRFQVEGGVLPWCDLYVATVLENGEPVHACRIDPCLEPGGALVLELSVPEADFGAVYGEVTINGEPAPSTVRWLGEEDGEGTEYESEDGRYRLERVRAGQIELVAQPWILGGGLGGLFPDLQAVVTIVRGGEVRCDFSLNVPLTRIHGRVSRPDGRPVAGAKVWVRGTPGNAHTITGADGSYEALVPEHGAPFTVVVESENQERRLADVAAFSCDADLVLYEQARLSLRIVDERSSDDVRGAEVEYRHAGEPEFAICMDSQTAPDHRGEYALELQAGEIELAVHAEHLGFRPVLQRLLLTADRTRHATIALEGGWTVGVRLKDGCAPLPEHALPFLVERHLQTPMLSIGDRHDRPWSCDARIVRFDFDGVAYVRGVGRGRFAFVDLLRNIRILPEQITIDRLPEEPIEIEWESIEGQWRPPGL